ncbi:MAG: DUF3226 domain-containing protein [Byssovorax sp.]
MARRALLVEGVADTTFYGAFAREIGIRSLDVLPPRSLGAAVDSKTNAIHILPTLLSQLDDGSLDRLGLVVDADYHAEHGLGFAATLAKIREQLVAHGFATEKRLATGGFLFEHPDGLPAVGAWIMPDNQHDGMLEDFIKASIADEQQRNLHTHASEVVGKLREPLFKPIHRSKADVSTWLSWQKMPGAGVEGTVGSKLIDLASPLCTAFSAWLETVFRR